MLDQNFNRRKILARIVIAIIALFALIWLFNYLTTAPITITTDSKDSTVKIAGILGEKNGKLSRQAVHVLHTRVHGGRYEISVSDKESANSTSRIITVKARHGQSFNLNLSKLVSAEPVYGKDVAGVAADSSQLLFIDTSTGNLQRVDAAGNITTVASMGFTNIQWASPNLGVAQSSNGSLYLIKDGQANQLQLPFATGFGQNISYDISGDGQIYIAFNGNVYSGDGSVAFKKIYTASGAKLTVSAGVGSVAILQAAPAASGDEGGSPKKQTPGQLTLLTDSNNKIVKAVTGVNAIAWSPDGKHLLATGRTTPVIFDSQLNTVGHIYINNASSLTWLGNSTIFYGIANAGSQLWAYDLDAQHSREVSLLDPANSITAIYPSQDGSYVYMSVQSGQASQLFKAPLQGQPVDKTLTTLNIFLPEDVGVCTLNYVNFIKPVMTILYPDSGVNPDNCVKAAKGVLNDYSVDSNKFSFITTAYEAE